METSLDAIGAELDALQAAARKAFHARDIKGYAAMFTDDLRYVQPDGKAIGLWQLMRDVEKQLRQFKSVDSEVVRESLTMNGDGTVTAVLRQKATYSVSVFWIPACAEWRESAFFGLLRRIPGLPASAIC